MMFSIAHSLKTAFRRHAAQEQKPVKETVYDVPIYPRTANRKFLPIYQSIDPKFCSIRVNGVIRVVVDTHEGGCLPCYADHQNDAYNSFTFYLNTIFPFTGSSIGAFALEVINHFGEEVMQVLRHE